MKKILFLFSVILLVGFSSCEGPQGPPGRDGSLNKIILDFEVTNANSANTWQYNREGQFYYCSINVPQLSRNIYNDGVVVAYIETQENNGTLVQQSLPRNISNANGTDKWIEMIDFDYSTGSIIFYFTTSDFLYEEWQPGNRYFRVVLMW